MKRLLSIVFMMSLAQFTQAQAPTSAVEYMDYFTSREQELSKKYLSYISEVSHGSRARKMEKQRQALLSQIKESLQDANKLRPYKGDASLRDAYKTYWDILYKVFNEDYHKIVNMEEIAEQSYDNMEAYLLAQERAGEVLEKANSIIPGTYRLFAANNNVRLIDDGVESKMEKKLKKISVVNKYYTPVYLIFFKCYKQEAYMLEAYNQRNTNGLEQNRNALIRYAEECLAMLDTMKSFQNDGSLLTACRKVLAFQKKEAEQDIPWMSEYLLKTDEFNKIKKAFEAKPANKRTQTDIDIYNKAIEDINAAIVIANKKLNLNNTTRDGLMNNWNVTKKNFMEHHMPRAK
jgi:hypothetical protein